MSTDLTTCSRSTSEVRKQHDIKIQQGRQAKTSGKAHDDTAKRVPTLCRSLCWIERNLVAATETGQP